MIAHTLRKAALAAVTVVPTAVIVAMALPVLAETPYTREARAAAPHADRYGDLPLETVIRTDERYGHDGLFQGPRGWHYWKYLQDPKPIQNPNLWTDTQSTYFFSRMAIPAGSSVTLRGNYPNVRYFQFALYKAARNTFVSIGEEFAGQEIEPDPGSTNPFKVGANRLAQPRNFTLRILAADPPSDPKRRDTNTLYAGKDGGELQGVLRIYLSDRGSDGAGWGPAASPFGARGLPDYSATLADGSILNAAQVVERFARPILGNTKQPLTAEQWVELVQAKDNDPNLDPATAPARKDPKWEKFWTLRYSLGGAFKSPAEREKIPYAGAMEGGGDGPYLIIYLSRKFGPLFVMRGKMPVFPNTYAGVDGSGLAVMPDAQTQYWSLVSCEAAPSGQIADGVTDMQVPRDADRNYTIVVSRRQDRPTNATLENGIAWVEWSPRGEGLDDPRNRTDFGMLLLRMMANNPSWAQSPDKVTKPGKEESIMGPYYPSGYYTTKADLEANGPKR